VPEDRLTPLHVLLFLLTCLSTLSAGAMMEGVIPWEEPARLAAGIPFSATLMTILLTHEMGHYLMSRRHGTPATLPYFIPAPSLIGTFGAVIRMRPPIMDRRALMDIGAAGPLAGFVLSVAAVGFGLADSTVLSRVDPVLEGSLRLGDPLVFRLMSRIVLGALPEQAEILLSPVAFAGWIGLFITALNLIPVGQLDGGHICYALFGPAVHARIGRTVVPVLLVLGFLWPGWAFWGVLLMLLGRRHPPVVLPFVELDPARRMIGWTSLAVFALSFTPAPFSGF